MTVAFEPATIFLTRSSDASVCERSVLKAGFLIAYAISQGYGLRGKFDWDVTRRSGGEIVLTPPGLPLR